MSFRPVVNAMLLNHVSRRITSMRVYMVNPYIQDGYPKTKVQPPLSGHVDDNSKLAVR